LTEGASLAINASVRKDLPFDPQRDLLPLSLVATTPSILVANPFFAASSVKELGHGEADAVRDQLCVAWRLHPTSPGRRDAVENGRNQAEPRTLQGRRPDDCRCGERSCADAELRKKLQEQALVAVGSSSEQLRIHFRKETEKWGELIKASGVTLE
jgi:hypothetical protein